MIGKPTVFVLGAGASNEIGLPLGEDLAKDIAGTLHFPTGDGRFSTHLVRAALHRVTSDPGSLYGKADDLARKSIAMSAALATAPSIDTFIDNHVFDPEVSLIGKIGIAACLIEAERQSDLRYARLGEPIDLLQVERTWYSRLFRILADGVRKESVHQIFENVSFIVFNYDRCLEHFLQHAIASRFILSLNEAAQVVRDHCRIIHPYGYLAPLDKEWSAVAYGQQLRSELQQDVDAIIRMAKNLRTFKEAQSAVYLADAWGLINSAYCLVFLGFGFHRQNIDLLTFQPRPDYTAFAKQFRSTALGMSDGNRREVLNRILGVFGGAYAPQQDNWLLNGKCCDLISAEHLFLSR